MSKSTTLAQDNTVKSYLDLDASNNELELELEEYTRSAVKKIHFTIILKPIVISFIALILSFFLDISKVPVLGNVTIDLAKSLFPNWKPVTETVEPFSFWWIPIIVYGLFVFLAFLAFSKLKLEIIRNPSISTIDRIVNSYYSVIDSIATALPLIGAAILLISIKLGEEIFLGLSVPFEVKALIVLALGKLFEPVIDQLGVEFQSIVNHVSDIRDKYFSRIQIENSKNILKQLENGINGNSFNSDMSLAEIERFKLVVEQSAKLSDIMNKNFQAIGSIAEKINQLESISSHKIAELNGLANSLNIASQSLSDEKTLTGLKYLESIVVKK